MAQNPAIDRNAGAGGFDWAFHQYDTIGADDDMQINQMLVGLPIQLVVNRDRWQETEADSGSPFNDVIHGDALERVVGPGGFSGCDALDPTGIARINNLGRLVKVDPITHQFPTLLSDVFAASINGYCPLVGQGSTGLGTGTVWEEGNILLGGLGSDLIEGRDNNDIIDGDHALTVALAVHDPSQAGNPEIGRTDLMEHPATSVGGAPAGNFGPGTAGMTLQQAVFAGLVDPGNIALVREIAMQDTGANTTTPNVTTRPSDCTTPVGHNLIVQNLQGQTTVTQPAGTYVDLATTHNCDTALYSKPLIDPATDASNYTITLNADGSLTVADNASVAAGPPFPKGDGVDTLWNFENLRFCTATDAVTKNCTAWEDHSIASLTGAVVTVTPVATLSLTSLGFAPRALPAGASAPLTVTLTNNGGGSLGITSSTITGANAAAFAISSNTCTASLTAGNSCTIGVTFDPAANAALTASLSIVTSVGTSTVALSGTGINNTPATGAPAISDTTPTEGHAITASLGTVADIDGVPGVVTYQWRQNGSPAGAILPAIIATGASFTPTQAQSNRRLQVTATFTDNAGTVEARPSAITTVVGDLFPGVGDNNAGIDVLAGTAGQDEYHGGASADNLATGAEDDLVSGDAGDDTISTAGGNDTITFSGTGEGFDAVTGGAGSDVIVPLTDGTTIGLRSISTVEDIDATGRTGIHILGSTANDVLNFTAVALTNIVSIDGGGGNDQITGSGGDDWIIGRAGTDTLNGGPGVDKIDGGAGNDTLRGGVGNDTFLFAAGFGNDTIADFDAAPAGGQDKIDLTSLGITAATFAANVSHTAGANTVVTVAGGGTIRLSGVNGAAIDASDFILAP